MAIARDEIVEKLKLLQDSICQAVQSTDGKSVFVSEKWNRPGGGGGDTRVIENGNIIAKGGVNFSAVFGKLPAPLQTSLGVDSADFFATGVSIVMHPNNPHVPIIHMNVRYFETGDKLWWFGGGIDLTPHYVVEEQANWFHDQLRKVCTRFDGSYYNRFTEWADRYFYIKHRKESRGVGGIFFDKLNEGSEGKSKDELFDFVLGVGSSFAPIYTHLMTLNHQKPYTALQRAWQLHRRSRYVEFNLVLDKGTRFGLETDGRIDSILMSLPPETGWVYTQQWPPDGEEIKTRRYLETVHVPSEG